MRALMILLAGCSGGGAADKAAPEGDTSGEGEPLAVLVSIEQPAPGTALSLGGSLVLAGSATDEAGNALPDAAFAWSSSVEGAIGEGASLTWTPQEAGEHVLTLQAELGGAVGAASADVTVTIPVEGGDQATLFLDEAGWMATDWRGLAVDSAGDVYGATANGLLVWRAAKGTVERYTAASGLRADAPQAVAVDGEGAVWLGYAGLVIDETVVEGERVALDPEAGTAARLLDVHFIETGEITSIFRIRIQPYGIGAGDVWFGTNEGLCVYDASLAFLNEHAHPTHPHGYTYGVAFTDEGDAWNGDQHQLSRWRFSNDGNLGGDDLFEYWTPWPVEAGVDLIDVADLDSLGGRTLYLASELHGVARVEPAADAGESVTDYPAGLPAQAAAIRVDPMDRVWVGTPGEGLYVLQHGDGTVVHLGPDVLAGVSDVQQLAVDARTDPPTVWAAGPAGLLRVVGLPGQ